jgi:hypothetical protein
MTMTTRVLRAWRALKPEQRLAALASFALLVTMFFPWYGLQSLNHKTEAINSHTINAFGDVSFVEAAVFLVAAGVVAMLFARAERRTFNLPGGDGTIVMVAGGWAALLIFYRVFDRPDGNGYPVGIEWGFFLAFVAAGALAYAGWRMHAVGHPGPPPMRSRRDTRPRFPTPPPSQQPPSTQPSSTQPARPTRRPTQVVKAPATEQLSFEDPPTHSDQGSGHAPG